MLSCAFQKSVSFSFTQDKEDKEEMQKIEGFQSIAYERFDSTSENNIAFNYVGFSFNKAKKDIMKSLSKTVNMAATIFGKRDKEDLKVATIIKESIDFNDNGIFQAVGTMDTYAFLLKHIKDSEEKKNILFRVTDNELEITQEQHLFYKKFAKKVIFFDATFKHSAIAKKDFVEMMWGKKVWEHYYLNDCFIYKDFDYESLLNHMKKLKERQKKYCFFMIVKEEKSYGLVIFNKTSNCVIELVCIGISEDNQRKFKLLLTDNNDYNVLENAVLRFLFTQYSPPVVQEIINRLGLSEKNNIYLLKQYFKCRETKALCLGCSGLNKRLNNSEKEVDVLNKKKQTLLAEYKNEELLLKQRKEQLLAEHKKEEDVLNQKKEKLSEECNALQETIKITSTAVFFKSFFGNASKLVLAVGFIYLIILKFGHF